MLQKLIALVEDNEDYLVKRTLEYAKLHNYTKYTSTLEEAGIASIIGLSKALADAAARDPNVPEIEVDQDFANNPIASFVVLEARFHRQRGVTLEMFLSMMKYYRQAYLDLVTESVADPGKRHHFLLWVNRFFDHNEISFCREWTSRPQESLLSELQMTNRALANEKNKYLTIFESIPTAAVILDAGNRCTNMNYAAQQLLLEKTLSAGYFYYSNQTDLPLFNSMFPWLSYEFLSFCVDEAEERSVEKEFDSPNLGLRSLLVKFQKMLDVSEKFEGTVISFTDMTEYKNIVGQLRHLSYHDQLTGLYNRAYLREEIIRFSSGEFNPVVFISIDVDSLKLVNETFGQPVGDMLLETVGRILRSCFRENDAVVRTGGDEFVIVLPTCDEKTAEKACQHIRDKINAYNKTSMCAPISISIGCSSGNLINARSFKDILKEADRRMYAEKQANHAKYETIILECFEKKKKGSQ